MSVSIRATYPSSKDSGVVAAKPRPASWLWLGGPYLIFLILFVGVPLGNLAVLSVYTYSPIQIWIPEFTTANYLLVFADAYYVGITIRTLRIAAITTAICIVLGYPLAYFLARCSARVLSIGLFLLVMPLMVSTVIRAFGWIVILGRNGVINSLLEGVGLPFRLDVLHSETAVIIALVQLVMPLMVLPLMASIEKIPLSLEEAASNLGATPATIFRKVLLPLSIAGLVSGSMLCFMVSVSVVVTPALVGGRSGRMLGNEIYDQVLTGLNWPFAASLSMLLVTLTFAIIVCVLVGGRLRARQEARR
jgi:ABC-type spermidine/putrescine transport system permease subunit I